MSTTLNTALDERVRQEALAIADRFVPRPHALNRAARAAVTLPRAQPTTGASPPRGASNGETPSELAAETDALRRQNENC